MTDEQLLDLIRPILGQPTAPFHEDAVRGEILQQLAKCPHVRVEIDPSGNIIAQYERGTGTPRFALVAHMITPDMSAASSLDGCRRAIDRRDLLPGTLAPSPFGICPPVNCVKAESTPVRATTWSLCGDCRHAPTA